MHIAVRLQAGLIAVSGVGKGMGVWRIELPPQTYSVKRPPEPVSKKTRPDWSSDTGGNALHSSFSPDSQVLAWVVEESHEVHLLVLPIEDPPEAGEVPDPRMEWENRDDEDEIKALEERLPKNMHRDFKWTSREASVGRAREVRKGEWAVNAGGACAQVAWSKASHFASVPDRTLLVLRQDCTLMVLLCCVGGKERRKGPVVLAGLCCTFQLPSRHAAYQVWWLRESGNSHDTHESLPRDPGENDFAPSSAEGSSHGDAWGGLQTSNVDSGLPEWLSGFRVSTPKRAHRKGASVSVQPPGKPDKDWVVCVGQDGTVLLCVVTFHLHRGEMDMKQNTIHIARTLKLQPRVGRDEGLLVLSSSFSLQAVPPRGGGGALEDDLPAGVHLLTVVESWGGSRRSLVHTELDPSGKTAVERNQYVAHCESIACVAAHSTRQYIATCTAKGEALVWHFEEGAGGGGSKQPLTCAALLDGSLKCLAWSPSE